MSAQAVMGRQWDEHASSEIATGDELAAAHRAVGGWRTADWKSAPVENVEVDKIKPTQRFLFQDQHERVRQAEGDLGPVRVVRAGSKHYVVDGHHRWDMAKERASKTIQARVIER